MKTAECPRCGERISEMGVYSQCPECDYAFERPVHLAPLIGEVEPPSPSAPRSGLSGRKGLGVILMVIGALASIGAGYYDITIKTEYGDQVANQQLMLAQFEAVIGALAFWFTGLLCFLIPAPRK